jgi:hypothetical protein
VREVQLVNEGGDLVLEYMDKDEGNVKEDKKVLYYVYKKGVL